jgi:glucose-1-phosphate cytidylyltransferase
MKTVILAGGAGSRLADETRTRPKPLVEIGGFPILWHIMRHYAHFGFEDFVIALGYKAEMIEEYVANHVDWAVETVETGLSTANGGRIKRLAPYLGNETFMMTWGDGVSDVNLGDLLEFHYAHGKLATLTAVHPPPRFGHLELDGDRVRDFREKPAAAEGWINGAFFVLEPGVFDYIEGDDSQWERAPLERLTADGQLMAYRHESFWRCMDTVHDKLLLEELWAGGSPPWRVWK